MIRPIAGSCCRRLAQKQRRAKTISPPPLLPTNITSAIGQLRALSLVRVSLDGMTDQVGMSIV